MVNAQTELDPTQKIAMILGSVKHTRGFIHELDNLPKELRLAGYHLGQQLEERDVIATISSDPSEEATAKLILSNLARILENRKPNLSFSLEYVVSGTNGAFVQAVLEQSVGFAFYSAKPPKIAKNAGIEPFAIDDFTRYLGVDPDIKLVADDICHLTQGVEHRIDSVKNFDDLVFLSVACLYAKYIKEKGLQEKAETLISGRNYTPRDLFYLTSVLYSQDMIQKIRKRNGVVLYSKNRKAMDIVRQVPAILFIECNARYPGLIGVAYDIDKCLGENRNRVLISPEGLVIDLSHNLEQAVMAQNSNRINELLTLAGIEDDSDIGAIRQQVLHTPYRGIKSAKSGEANIRDFFTFLDELPARILQTPMYDPKDKDFRKGDKVIPYAPNGIIRYRFGDNKFTPMSFAPGTICEVVDVEGEKISVKKEKDENIYNLHKDEIGKLVAGKTLPVTDLNVKILKLVLEPEIDAIRLPSMFMFKPDKYKDVLRWCISNLYEAGLSINKIKELVMVDKLGLIEFEGGGTELGEWLPGTVKHIDKSQPLPQDPKNRVREVFSQHPSCVAYSELKEGDSAERSLCYLLMHDTNVPYVSDFLKKRNSAKRYVLAVQSIEHNNDDVRLITPLEYHKKSLKAMLVECAVCTYQSLLGVKGEKKHTGMKMSQYARHMDDPIGEVVALLDEADERADQYQTASTRFGRVPIISGNSLARREPMHELDRPISEVEYNPAVLLQYELFQGLKDGVDIDGATERCMQLLKGYEGFVEKAKNVKDVRFLIGAAAYGYVMKIPRSVRQGFLKQKLTPHQLFLEYILMFVDKTMQKTEKVYLRNS